MIIPPDKTSQTLLYSAVDGSPPGCEKRNVQRCPAKSTGMVLEIIALEAGVLSALL